MKSVIFHYLFHSPVSDLGVSHNFTSVSVPPNHLYSQAKTIKVSGYDNNIGGSHTDVYNGLLESFKNPLYIKSATNLCATGIFTNSTSDETRRSKTSPYFVQFDLIDFANIADLSIQIQISSNSNQTNEYFQIFGSTKEASLGSFLTTNALANNCSNLIPIILPSSPLYRFLNVKAAVLSSDLVISSLRLTIRFNTQPLNFNRSLDNGVYLDYDDNLVNEMVINSIPKSSLITKGYLYLGVFQDVSFNEDLTHSLPTKYPGSLYTPDTCFSVARVDKYSLFGLRNGGECW